jgi:hypothetical protein
LGTVSVDSGASIFSPDLSRPVQRSANAEAVGLADLLGRAEVVEFVKFEWPLASLDPVWSLLPSLTSFCLVSLSLACKSSQPSGKDTFEFAFCP